MADAGRGRGRGLADNRFQPGQSVNIKQEGNGNGNGHSVRPRDGEDGSSQPKRFRQDDTAGPSQAAGPSNAGEGRGDGRGRGQLRRRRDEIVVTRPSNISITTGKEMEFSTTIVANYFKLISTPNWALHQYHVDFDPVIDSTRLKRAMVQQQQAELGVFIFDGMTLFSISRIRDEDEFELQSIRRTDQSTINMKFRFIHLVPSTDPIVLQVLNIQMRKNYRYMRFQQLNRYYYDPTVAQAIPQHNLEVWPGFITAIHRHEMDVLLHADLTFKILRKDTVLDQLNSIRQRFPRDFRVEAGKELIGCIILTRYNNRTYRLDDINWDMNPASTFPLKTGSQSSFVEYYRSHWNIDILNPTQPMLVSQPRMRDENRGIQGPIILVPELCVMTGLSEATRINFAVMRDISAHTRVDPNGRVARLTDFMDRIQNEPSISRDMRGWNVSFESNLLVIKARVLKKEKIIQRGVTYDFDRNSSDWSKEMRSQTLFEAVPIHKWVIIHSGNASNEANGLRDTLRRVCPPMGVNLGNARMVNLRNDSPQSFANGILDCHTPDLQLVVCVVPDAKKDRYDAIKKICCIDRPVASQVVVRKTLSRQNMLMSVATKIGIQLNCKLGGSAWAVELPMKGAMVIGYDAYRDSSRQLTTVGAVCCSLNNELTKYHSRVAFQTAANEMVDGLVENIAAGLNRYREIHNTFPARIFIYRDGVSEGQLLSIRDNELTRILDTLRQLGIADPKLAFFVVSKRISTRIMERGNGGNYKNPVPGTVVDTIITRPEWYDFFLVSQSVRQGTVAPTHYNIIHDTSGLRPDHLQRLTYKLTHLYYNWPGTIRVPAPCMYAHKMAFLTSQSLHQVPNAALADRLFYL